MNIEKSLHYWGKSHLFRMYDPFNVLLDLVFLYFVEDSLSIFMVYWPVIFFFCDTIVLVSRSWWPYIISLELCLPLQFISIVLEG